ncbi:nucleoside phosphorylase [Flagellimonas sp. 389]|uniref:nucleoside phosphorylase n=1 Tax=Flagellimonas sp. 389 TaxID=2835862 RepID=UPI001BD67CFB|nr:nucleoside phosphorylase [Flagellimonas sp. 389]MBS9463442.1 nucleoside phosphorylase [Flagellimonas sp. 389]
MTLGHSELILNPDGSIYHLNLLPQDIAPTIITVGDPDRVRCVSAYFDTIEVEKGKREFLTHTGSYKGKPISVVSTGIGTDNIDIVFNELDALVNIDFTTRQIKSNKTRLDFIRIGTSGAIQADIGVDTFLLSKVAVGFEGLLHFYRTNEVTEKILETQLNEYLGWKSHNITAYAISSNKSLREKFLSNRIRLGITVTNSGFYGPQGRRLRLMPQIPDFNNKLAAFTFENQKITNLEMETAGIYGLSKLLGHRAISLNVILANRATGEFSKNPDKTIDSLIRYALEKLTQ